MSEIATSSDEDHRVRAIAQLRLCLANEIDLSVQIAKVCGLWEILGLCYIARIGRIGRSQHEEGRGPGHASLAEMQLRDEACKYALSLVAKHGDWRTKKSAINSVSKCDFERVMLIEKMARKVNARFDSEKLLNVANVRVAGDRGQYCEVRLDEIEDPRRRMHLDFGLRIEHSTMSKKSRLHSGEEIVEHLRQDYADVADLFEAEFGITLEAYCNGMLGLIKLMHARAKIQWKNVAVDENGYVDYEARKTFAAFAEAMYFTDSQLSAALRPEFVNYMKRHSFDGKRLSDEEIRFHYITRRPFLIGKGFAILNQELIFDSLFDNAHFTLLESAEAKDRYKARRSVQFVDEIVQLAAAAGYAEVARDVDLIKGKQKLGDIDVVLSNAETGHTLLVEAKNHALPLPVYFGSPEALDAHVTRTHEWEQKVQRRIDHLRGDSPSFSPLGQWDYVIVSNMPEPLAHVSKLLILSVEEFASWIGQGMRTYVFADFYRDFYKPDQATMSEDEMLRLVDEGFSLARPVVGR